MKRFMSIVLSAGPRRKGIWLSNVKASNSFKLKSSEDATLIGTISMVCVVEYERRSKKTSTGVAMPSRRVNGSRDCHDL